MTTFDSTKESLLDLLQSVKQGKTQLDVSDKIERPFILIGRS